MAIINVKSLHDLSGFYVVYKGSVRNEKKGWFGLSHLMEHLICHHLDDMLDDFDRDGIAWNAYTSSNEVCFYYTGLDEYLSKHRETILRKLLTFSITEEQFENERKIVLEEYSMYFNKQAENHQLNLSRKLFGSFEAIGLREDLENLKYQDIKDYFNLQFSNPHLIINVSKNTEFKTDIKFSNQRFENEVHIGQYDVPLEPYNGRNGKSSIINISEVISEDFAYVDFICNMLGAGLKSPLYQEIREKRGLVYYVQCSLDRVTDKSGVVCISSESSDTNVEEFQKQLNEVLSNPVKYMTQERFDIVKQSIEIKIKKAEINRFNSVNKYITPMNWQIESILKEITLDKVMNVYNKYFDFSKFIKSIDTQEFNG